MKYCLMKYSVFNFDAWGMNKAELLEIESKFRYFGERFHLDESVLCKCDRVAMEQTNEKLLQCKKPLQELTRIIALEKMRALLDGICATKHLQSCDFVITVSGKDYSFDVGLLYKGKRIETIKEDLLTMEREI